MKLPYVVMSAFLMLPVSRAVQADIVFYTNRTAFEAAAGALTTETFESANVLPGAVAGVEGPVTSLTDNDVFSPGDIVTHISVNTFPGHNGIVMPVLGSGVLTGQSRMIGTQFEGFTTNFAMQVGFDIGMSSVAADLFAANEPGNSLDIDANVWVYDTNGFGIGSTTVDLALIDGGFFGAISDTPIGAFRVQNVQEPGGDRITEFIDNISFKAPSVPEPSTGLVCLAGLAAFAGIRRNRR